MGAFSLNTKSLNAKATFFGISKLLSSSSLGSLYSSRVAVTVDEGPAAVATAVVGSGLTLTALYLTGIPDQARLCYGYHSNVLKWIGCILAFPHQRPTSFRWLDPPADYVPPKMDLFSDDTAPLGFSSPYSCPVNSEHLERSFDLLRYQHAFKQLGVPSVVNSGIRLVTSSTGSSSHGGTSTDIDAGRFSSISPGGSPNPFLDRPRPSANRGSNNGAGSGSGGNPAGPPDLTPACRKPSAQGGYKLARFGPPPPPPPPPPGSSDAEDDDTQPGFGTSSDWSIAWKAILLGACISQLLNKFFPNRKQISRKGSGQAPPTLPLDVPKNEVDISGADMGLESGVITLPAFVDEVLQMDTDVCINSSHTYRKPVERLSRLAGFLPRDTFLKQFLTFSAGTGNAIAVLLLLVSYTVLRRIITAMGIFRTGSTTTTLQEASTLVVHDDPCEEMDDTTVEADDDTDYAEAPTDLHALDEDSDVDSDIAFENAWLANEFQAPVEALDAPVEVSDVEPAVIFENDSFWAADTQTPVEAFDAPVEDSDVDTTAFSEDDSFWTTGSQAPVEAHNAPVDVETTSSEDDLFWTTGSQAPVVAHNAPVEDSDVETTALSKNDSFGTTQSSVNGYCPVPDHFDDEFDDDTTPRTVVKQTWVEAPARQFSSSFDDNDDESFSSDCVQIEEGFSPGLGSTKSFSKIVAQDSFHWDRHSSFDCSTPLTRLGALSEAGSFDYGRGLSPDISVPDSDVANMTTNIPTIATNTLQELEITKKNLDTIIEAQIKRAESSFSNKPRLDSHLQVRNVNRSLSSSIWANTPGSSGHGDRFIPSQRSLSSSIWASTPASSSRLNTHVPSNNIAGTPEVEKTQQVPGRRRRHRPRGRNRGRGPSGEHSVEEGDASSDVPNWAIA